MNDAYNVLIEEQVKVRVLRAADPDFLALLKQIPDSPKQLYYQGDNLAGLCKSPCVAIVGSRKVSTYGRSVTEKLAGELAKQGVVIISGLALGVDSIAHQAALDAGGRTIAVLPTGLDHIYPASHTHLARKIVESGGALVTEYPFETPVMKHQFLARNRIISGLSYGVIVTEAAAHSGSLNTANFALEQGREVMAVPGNITSLLSAGTNNLIKSGATPITCVQDVLDTLELEFTPIFIDPARLASNDQERQLLILLGEGITNAAALLSRSKLEASVLNQTLTMLEIAGIVKNAGNNNWSLS